MAYPISFIAANAGLGNSWFYARMQRPSDALWYHYSGASAGTFAASAAPLTDTEIRIPLDEIGQREYGRTISSLGTYRLHIYAHDDIAVGDPIRAQWYVNLVDGDDAGTELPEVDLDGPPYSLAAGHIFPAQGRRGIQAPMGPEVNGTIFAGTAPTFLGRVVNAGGQAINSLSIDSISYTIYRLSETDPEQETAVTGHTAVTLEPSDVLLAELSRAYLWEDTDQIGFNFIWTPNVAGLGQAFATAQRHYRVKVTLTPTSGQAFQLRFLPWAI